MAVKALNLIMKLNFQLLLCMCIMTITIHAQEVPPPSVNIGDSAPPMRLRSWLKGVPVQGFEKGTVYVVEFWATWCLPCKAEIPHLSAMAHEYKDKVTFIGVDVYEKRTTSLEKIKAFVDSMGNRMDYKVTAEDSNFMAAGWLYASGEQVHGIPRSFVVNAEGRLAWIGHPKDLAKVLPKIVNNSWDIKEASAKRISDMRLRELDDSLQYDLAGFIGSLERVNNQRKSDSLLSMIDQMVRGEPSLKYAPRIGFYTFASLLRTNPRKAYEYGKVLMVTPAYDDPEYEDITGPIALYSNKLKLPSEIYQLGAEAYQAEIDQVAYPELVNIPKLYDQMANCCWHASDQSKAIDAEQKAIEALKRKKDFSEADLAEYKSKLQLYKNR
jgi:thiol-disulfide isomerase/thioredoxin